MLQSVPLKVDQIDLARRSVGFLDDETRRRAAPQGIDEFRARLRTREHFVFLRRNDHHNGPSMFCNDLSALRHGAFHDFAQPVLRFLKLPDGIPADKAIEELWPV